MFWIAYIIILLIILVFVNLAMRVAAKYKRIKWCSKRIDLLTDQLEVFINYIANDNKNISKKMHQFYDEYYAKNKIIPNIVIKEKSNGTVPSGPNDLIIPIESTHLFFVYNVDGLSNKDIESHKMMIKLCKDLVNLT